MPGDDVDKFLTEEKSMEDRRQALIDALLKQKATAMKEFDDKLAKLGHPLDGRSRRSHHKKEKAASAAEPKTKA